MLFIKFSFIAPIYNSARYLERCLGAVLAQTETDFEVLMIYEPSSDSSQDICGAYSHKDTRFRLIFTDGRGLSAARNTGLAQAKGEYISFLDSDDYIEPDYCEILYKRARENDADILIFGYKRNMPDADDIDVTRFEYKSVDLTKADLLGHFCVDWLLPRRMSFVWSKLYRAALIKNSGVSFVHLPTEDRVFNYSLFFRSEKTVYVDATPYFYYQHDYSATYTVALNENYFLHYFNAYQYITAYWKKNGIDCMDDILPVVFIRMAQGAMYNTQRALRDLSKTADVLCEAMKRFNISDILRLPRLRTAINIYAEKCELSWARQSMLWLFALSLLSGKEGIISWQKMYDSYSKLAANQEGVHSL
ncbi:MAG: glycosyltransferase [Clostridiales bacterium]|nr:glycosyltransferase [Clostridiales bacterium]